VLKGTHFVSVENVKQKRWRSTTTLQNMTCGIALNIGSVICSCVSTQKGTILKVILVDFLNLLNRKSYRHSLVFLCHTSYTIFFFATQDTIFPKKYHIQFSCILRFKGASI